MTGKTHNSGTRAKPKNTVRKQPIKPSAKPSAKAFVAASLQRREQETNNAQKRYTQIITLQLLLTIALAIGVIYSLTQPTKNVYFAVTEDGRMRELAPLHQALLSEDIILDLTTKWVRRAHSYSFSDYRADFQDASKGFTKQGWRNFMAAFEASGNLNYVRKNRAIVTASITENPIILQSGLNQQTGRYFWDIQFRMTVTYTTSSQKQEDPMTITVRLVRVREEEKPYGVAIDRFISK